MIKTKIFIAFSCIFFLILTACRHENQKQDVKRDTSLIQLNLNIEKNPNNDALYFNRALYFLKEDSLDAAILDFEKAIALDSTTKPVYYLALADAYLENAQSKTALRLIEKSMQFFPNDKSIILKYAKINLILKQHMAALATLDKIFLMDPQNADAYYLAGHIFYEIGDTGRAVNSYQRAVDFNPDFKEAWMQIGDVLTEMKNQRALSYYENAILLDSLDPVNYHKKAHAFYIFGKIQESISLYKKICIQFPSYEPAFFNLGFIYMELDSINLAIEHFTISTQINPTEASSFFERGMCYLKSNLPMKAKADFETALRLDDQYENARIELNKLQ